MESVVNDWRFLVFILTLVFQSGILYSQFSSTKKDIFGLKTDIEKLEKKVLNGITTKLNDHSTALATIQSRCETRISEEQLRDRRHTDV